MSCLQTRTQLSGSQELRHHGRSQKMIQTNAKILGRAGLHSRILRHGGCETLCGNGKRSPCLRFGFLGRPRADNKDSRGLNGRSRLVLYEPFILFILPQVWRVTRTSSSCSKGETCSRFAPAPGRRHASSNSRRTAGLCGTSRRSC